MPHDPLLYAMVRRANIYLQRREIHEESKVIKKEGRAGLSATSTRKYKAYLDWITNRELADLGDLRCPIITKIVNSLHRSDRLAIFNKLGLTQEEIIEEQWRTYTIQELVELLLSWTGKQVRDRFDKLRRHGLIDFARPSGNGPLRYRLPHELKDNSSPFSQLWKPDRLEEWLVNRPAPNEQTGLTSGLPSDRP
jgi:hypothetical protein